MSQSKRGILGDYILIIYVIIILRLFLTIKLTEFFPIFNFNFNFLFLLVIHPSKSSARGCLKNDYSKSLIPR